MFNLKGKKTTKERAQDRELISFGSLFYFISIELKRNKTIRNEINQEPKIQPTFHYIWLRFSSFYLTFSSNITGFSFTFRTNEAYEELGQVITNLLSPFPSLIEWLCGGHYIYNPTLKRFFVFHFLFPFVLCAFLLFHIFNLHFLSSNNPLRNSTNNKIAFFPFIISKDFYGKILILYLYLLQIHFGFSSFSHPDNALEACGLLTPLHIVPEWYFLCQYAMLKAVPNKNAGFIILFTSIFILFYFMRSLSMSFYFIIKTSNRFNGFYLCFWFLSLFSFIWIGGQFPVDNFLSYGRILTLHYYLLIFWFRGLVVPFVLFSHYILFYSVSGSFWLSYLLVSFSLSHYTPFFPWVYIVCSLLTLHYILFLIFGLLSFINYKKEANHYIYFTFYSVPFWLFPSFQPH